MPVIQGAYMTTAVCVLKLTLLVIKHSFQYFSSSFSKNPEIKDSITCLVYCQNCPSDFPELQGYIVMYNNFLPFFINWDYLA